jgi:hypothetical protein
MTPNQTLVHGQTVETIKPDVESKDWRPEALANRRWSVTGKIVDHSDSHGLCYLVLHEDDTTAWYERRELKPFTSGVDYSPEERAAMLKRMGALSAVFYGQACAIGVHAFIEFCGLMNEFIKVCAEAHKVGHPFPVSNTHTGAPLPFKPYHVEYLAEKLNCIYGPALFAEEANRRAFIETLFDGQFKLVPADRRFSEVSEEPGGLYE